MDTLKSMMVFRAVVEQGSFTKAAEHLNMSVAMTSKHLHVRINRVVYSLFDKSNFVVSRRGLSYLMICEV